MTTLPRGSIVVPFCGFYVGSYKAIPKKELQRSLWVNYITPKPLQTLEMT